MRSQQPLQSQNNYEWLFQQQCIAQNWKDDSFAIPPCLKECLTNNFFSFFSSTEMRQFLGKREWKLSQRNLKWQVKDILLMWLIRSLLVVKFKILVYIYIHILLFLFCFFLFHLLCLNMWKNSSVIELVKNHWWVHRQLCEDIIQKYGLASSFFGLPIITMFMLLKVNNNSFFFGFWSNSWN